MAQVPHGGGPPEARYANYFEVGHNALEFVLDFGRCYAGEPAVSHTRIVTSPAHAKVLLETLRESVRRYERNIGTIPWPE